VRVHEVRINRSDIYPARTAVQVLRLLSAVANAYIAHGVICSPDILVAAWNSRTALEENCL